MNHARNTILLAALALVMMTGGALAAAHDLRPGEAAIGETKGLASNASFDLNLAAGDAIRMAMKAKGPGDHAPSVEVRDPAGDAVAAAAGERKMKLSFTAAESGVYTIHVAADESTSPRFVLKVKGDAKRRYSSRDGSVEFGAPEGAVVSMKVKTNGPAEAAMSDARGREIEHNMKETADNRRAAEGRLNDARRRKDELTREISSIRDEAESQGGREKERILAETESEAQRLKNQATQDIETLSRYGVSELRAFAAALATRRAGQRIRERLTPDDHSRLIDQSIERLEKLYEKPSSG